eukprot:scaffold3142_cov101-Isochrysis_galbana.AAC.2
MSRRSAYSPASRGLWLREATARWTCSRPLGTISGSRSPPGPSTNTESPAPIPGAVKRSVACSRPATPPASHRGAASSTAAISLSYMGSRLPMVLDRRTVTTLLDAIGTDRTGADATALRTPLRRTSSPAALAATEGTADVLVVTVAATASGWEDDACAARLSAAVTRVAYSRNSAASASRSSVIFAETPECDCFDNLASSSARWRRRNAAQPSRSIDE